MKASQSTSPSIGPQEAPPAADSWVDFEMLASILQAQQLGKFLPLSLSIHPVHGLAPLPSYKVAIHGVLKALLKSK